MSQSFASLNARLTPGLRYFSGVVIVCVSVRVTDSVALRFRCRNLVYASFCYCEHVTDAGVELLGNHLTSLTSLDLSGCNIQDQGVAALGNNPKFLDITLAECPNITDLGLQVRYICFVGSPVQLRLPLYNRSNFESFLDIFDNCLIFRNVIVWKRLHDHL